MKKLFLFLLMLSLNSCGGCSKDIATLTGYANVCIDGVHYLQFPSGVTPKFKPDGTIVTCKD
jgi:hypothetical protein